MSEKLSASVLVAKLIAFGLPLSIISVLLERHPNAAAFIGFNVGAFCAYLIRPRQPALWIVLLTTSLASGLYLIIVHH